MHGNTNGYINTAGEFAWKTDCWDEPVRNKVAEPLATFLTNKTVRALPLSYNWDVENAIVFVADGTLEDMRTWVEKRCVPDDLEFSDGSDPELEPGKIEFTIYRTGKGYLEIYAMAGTADEEEVDGFVSFYSCDNMHQLRKDHPKKMIGILLEN